jgi:hypothetical protein
MSNLTFLSCMRSTFVFVDDADARGGVASER